MRWTHEILFPKVCLSAVVCHKRSHFSWRVFTLDFTWNWCWLLEAEKFSTNPGQFKWVAWETRHYISIAELLKWNLMGQVVELFRRPSIFPKFTGDKFSYDRGSNCFIYRPGRHNLEPGRLLQQNYWPRRPPWRIPPGHLDRVSKCISKCKK